MIEPDVTPKPARRRTTTFVVIAALVAGLGGLALAVNDSGDSLNDERSVAARGKVANPEPAALPASEQAADMATGGASSRMMAPSWGGLEIDVDGDLPELDGRGASYRFEARDLTKVDVARMAAALGLHADPTGSAQGWTVTTADGRLQAYPGPDGWSVSFQRGGFAEGVEGKISAEAAEDVARRLLSAMGVFEGQWAAQAYESSSQGGFDLACESALKELEARRVEGASSQPSGGTASGSAAGNPVATDEAKADYPAPEACAGRPEVEPVFAQNVSFTAVLDGVRSDWTGWSVNVRADKVVDGVYGTVAALRAAETYELRGTKAALEELRSQSNPVVSPTIVDSDVAPAGEPTTVVPPKPAIASDGIASDDATTMEGAGSDGSAGSGSTSSGGGTAVATPAVAPDAPVSSIAPEPAPDGCLRDAKCGQPQKVVITSVERTLTSTSIWEGDTPRMRLVPGYRFIGHFEDDDRSPYEVTVLAIDPKITMPPAVSPGGTPAPPGVKAVPPMAVESKPSR